MQSRFVRSGLPSSLPGLHASTTTPWTTADTGEHFEVSPVVLRTRPSFSTTISARMQAATTKMGFSTCGVLSPAPQLPESLLSLYRRL